MTTEEELVSVVLDLKAKRRTLSRLKEECEALERKAEALASKAKADKRQMEIF